MRTHLQAAFRDRSPLLWALWLAPLIVCAVLPGPGVLLAGIFVVTLVPLARQPFSTIGLSRPDNPARFLASAIVLGLIAYLMGNFAIDPLASRLIEASPDVSRIGNIEGNWSKLAFFLSLSWIVGAFFEEVLFRGFLIELGIRLLGARAAWPLAIGGSVLFGWAHLYQGASGVLTTGLMGLLFASIYLLTGRKLLLVMIVHGTVDTVAFLLAFSGARPLS